KKDTIACFARYFKEIVSALSHNPDRTLAVLQAPSEIRKEEILQQLDSAFQEELHTFAKENPHPVIQDLLNRSLERFHNFTAVEYGDRAVTYGELEERAGFIVQVIEENNIRVDSFIGIFTEDRLFFIEALIACLNAGRGFVPLDPALPHARLEQMIESTGLEYIMTDSSGSAFMTTDTGHRLKDGGVTFISCDKDEFPDGRGEPCVRPTTRNVVPKFNPDDQI
ncbi:MAG: AMP-binding protein, partial [bacterium]|nr:AMP-binding protein [bacterium]